MIGSSTLIVKDGNSYRVHIIGGIILHEVTVDEMVKLDEKYKKKPEAVLTDGKDIFKILSSHQCMSPAEPDYSEFAGDRRWFLNLDTKSFININEFVNNHRQRFSLELETERQIQEKMRKAKTQKLVSEAKRHSKILCKEMIAILEGKSTVPYVPQQWSSGDTSYDQLEFKIGHFVARKSRRNTGITFSAPCYTQDYELIRGKFDFQKILLNYLKENGWSIKAYSISMDNRTWIANFIAQKRKLVIAWNYMDEKSIHVVNPTTV